MNKDRVLTNNTNEKCKRNFNRNYKVINEK